MSNTGSLINMIADQSTGPWTLPEVGMGATEIMWTDRRAGTIVEVSRTGHKITVQMDKAVRTDGRGMTDAQSYRYERDTEGRLVEATRRRDGSYRVKGGQSRVLIGVRDAYHDFSF